MNRRRLGSLQEQKAVEYLQECGYVVEARNYQTRFAEIDIVAREGGYLCFVEVKYRSGTKYGAPDGLITCLLYTSPSPRDPKTSRMPSSA